MLCVCLSRRTSGCGPICIIVFCAHMCGWERGHILRPPLFSHVGQSAWPLAPEALNRVLSSQMNLAPVLAKQSPEEDRWSAAMHLRLKSPIVAPNWAEIVGKTCDAKNQKRP